MKYTRNRQESLMPDKTEDRLAAKIHAKEPGHLLFSISRALCSAQVPVS